MHFLDPTLETRPTGSNIVECTVVETPTESVISEEESTQNSTPHSNINTTQNSNYDSETPTGMRPSAPKKLKQTFSEDVDKVLEYLEKKNKKPSYDAVDYLFLSYAQTFKQFSIRNQAKIKVTLANLFAETELLELNPSQPCFPPQPSPSYSTTLSIHSDNSAVVIDETTPFPIHAPRVNNDYQSDKTTVLSDNSSPPLCYTNLTTYPNTTYSSEAYNTSIAQTGDTTLRRAYENAKYQL